MLISSYISVMVEFGWSMCSRWTLDKKMHIAVCFPFGKRYFSYPSQNVTALQPLQTVEAKSVLPIIGGSCQLAPWVGTPRVENTGECRQLAVASTLFFTLPCLVDNTTKFHKVGEAFCCQCMQSLVYVNMR